MERKKIGILTFHNAHNYGAVLQVWALSHCLMHKGYFVEVINYQSKVNNRYRLSLFFKRRNFFKLFWDMIFVFRRKYKRYKTFDKFIKEKIPISKTIAKTKDDLKTCDYDIYVVGSDQVWNTGITCGIDDVYWGEFESKVEARKISYAASNEGYPYQDNEKNKIKSRLCNFSFISTREREFSTYLQNLTSTSISTVLDPTLLISHDVYESMAILPPSNIKFVLIYQVVENTMVRSFAARIARQLGVDIIEIRSEIKGSIKEKNVVEAAGPEEFLGYFKTAQCVVTTSFHGTAFSLIFEKDFYFIDLKNNAKRSTALLKDLFLEDRIAGVSEDIEFSEIDYDQPLQRLHKKKVSSLDFLSTALG